MSRNQKFSTGQTKKILLEQNFGDLSPVVRELRGSRFILLGNAYEMIGIRTCPLINVLIGEGLTVAALYWNPCLRRLVTSFPNYFS